MSNFGEVERLLRDALRENRDQPEKLLLMSLLLLRVRGDAQGALGPIRESVRLAPKRLSSLVLQEEVLRALGDRSEAAKVTQIIRGMTTDPKRLEKARRRLNEKIPSPGTHQPVAKAPLTPQDTPRLVILAAVVMLALLVLGGSWWSSQPDRVNADAYLSQLPVVSAIAPGNKELILRIEKPVWKGLQPEERESKLHGVMKEASTQGFQAVYVHSVQDQLLGSVQGSQTFIVK